MLVVRLHGAAILLLAAGRKSGIATGITSRSALSPATAHPSRTLQPKPFVASDVSRRLLLLRMDEPVTSLLTASDAGWPPHDPSPAEAERLLKRMERLAGVGKRYSKRGNTPVVREAKGSGFHNPLAKINARTARPRVSPSAEPRLSHHHRRRRRP